MIIDPAALLNTVHYAGYALMGLVGLYGAWRRTRPLAAGAKLPTPSDANSTPPEDRVDRVERDLSLLRTRQDQLHQETNVQQTHILKQQTAMFDLLVQQRSTLDKILTKMTGL